MLARLVQSQGGATAAQTAEKHIAVYDREYTGHSGLLCKSRKYLEWQCENKNWTMTHDVV